MRIFVLLLEIVFFTGLAGSLVVAVMAFVGDIHVFFDEDKEKSKEPAPAATGKTASART